MSFPFHYYQITPPFFFPFFPFPFFPFFVSSAVFGSDIVSTEAVSEAISESGPDVVPTEAFCITLISESMM